MQPPQNLVHCQCGPFCCKCCMVLQENLKWRLLSTDMAHLLESPFSTRVCLSLYASWVVVIKLLCSLYILDYINTVVVWYYSALLCEPFSFSSIAIKYLKYFSFISVFCIFIYFITYFNYSSLTYRNQISCECLVYSVCFFFFSSL